MLQPQLAALLQPQQPVLLLLWLQQPWLDSTCAQWQQRQQEQQQWQQQPQPQPQPAAPPMREPLLPLLHTTPAVVTRMQPLGQVVVKGICVTQLQLEHAILINLPVHVG